MATITFTGAPRTFPSYQENGFTFTSSQKSADALYNPNSDDNQGDRINSNFGGATVTIARTDGNNFDLSSIDLDGYEGASDTITFTAQTSNGPVTRTFTTDDQQGLQNVNFGPEFANISSVALTETNADGYFNTFDIDNVGVAVVCFTTGTLIRTDRGDVAVEHLAVGDLAVTASDEHRPIRWIGSRTVNCRGYAEPQNVMPVCIAAGSLGENRPARDLVVSPGHAICLDVLGEVLIPAAALVNGTTITQQDVDSVTYWHVELDSHDILLAESQPAESYIDMGNRAFFVDATGIEITAHPDASESAARSYADYCRPVHTTGALVEAVRQRLRVHAETLGWSLVKSDTWADVHLEVDGAIIQPKIRGMSACFLLPAVAEDVWLVSPTSIPRHVGDNPIDPRSLGLCLSGLSLNDGLGEAKTVALDNPLLCLGFHEPSPGHRWTEGRAQLSAALLMGLEGEVFLRLDLAGPPLPRWVAPELDALKEDAPEAPRLSLVAA